MTKLNVAMTTFLALALLSIDVQLAHAQTPAFVRSPCEPQPNPSQLLPGRNCRNVTVDNYVRESLVYVPDGLTPGTPAPLVFAHHPATGTMEYFAAISGWREVANREGLIVVFPQGLQYYVMDEELWSSRWSTYGLGRGVDISRRLPGYPEDSPWPTDDVAFVLAMIDEVSSQWAIDERRIFAAGFSNGAAFVSRLAHEIPHLIAAVSVSGAGFSAGLVGDLMPAARSIPVHMMLGNRDRWAVDTEGILPLDPDTLLALPGDPFDVVTGAFGYSAAPCATSLVRDDAMLLLEFCDVDPADGAGVLVFALIRGMGHEYANPGNNSAGLWAAQAAWDFFSEHPLPP